MDAHDHRALGPELDLFHQQDEAPGIAVWHPRGATIYRLIENYIHDEMSQIGFNEVRTPQLLSRSLWERSGHWAKFGENMFGFEDGERSLALKPMSCPGHIQLFRQQIRSYKELPVRYAEFGVCHRYEPSGTLHGLMRGRAFTQDDAHVFCLPEHIDGEVGRFCELLKRVYRKFGFEEYLVGLSTRPEVREGSDATWDEAETRLANAARAAGLEYRDQPDEGAFYGPKLEFILKDRDGREWQCGTIQLDLILPEKLDAKYIDFNSDRVHPVMIHHAVMGSVERFLAILLEHHRGRLPFWLAPEQIVVAPISDDQSSYADSVSEFLTADGFRSMVARPNETLSRRIVDANGKGIPIFITVGRKEVSTGDVSIRDSDGQQTVRSIADAIEWLKELSGST